MEPICIICLDILTPTEKILITPCGHVSHDSCLKDWFQSSRSCPNCRELVLELKPVFLQFMDSQTEDNISATLQNQLETVHTEMESLHTQLFDKNKLIAETVVEMSKLESQLGEKNMLIDKHENEIKKLQQISFTALTEKRKELENLMKKLESTEKTCSALKKSVADLSEQLAEERAKYRKMISAAAAQVKQTENLGENSVKVKAEMNVSQEKKKKIGQNSVKAEKNVSQEKKKKIGENSVKAEKNVSQEKKKKIGENSVKAGKTVSQEKENKIGENSVNLKTKKNVSGAKVKTQTSEALLDDVNQNSQQNRRYNLRPR